MLYFVVGILCFLAGIVVGDRHKEDTELDEDIDRDFTYYQNLSESLLQDVSTLREENRQLKEQVWQLKNPKKK